MSALLHRFNRLQQWLDAADRRLDRLSDDITDETSLHRCEALCARMIDRMHQSADLCLTLYPILHEAPFSWLCARLATASHPRTKQLISAAIEVRRQHRFYQSTPPTQP